MDHPVLDIAAVTVHYKFLMDCHGFSPVPLGERLVTNHLSHLIKTFFIVLVLVNSDISLEIWNNWKFLVMISYWWSVSNHLLHFIPALNLNECKMYVFKHICLQVLFVKNLSNRVKEVDLVSVFGHLDDQGQKRIIYRLMTGRMKGQAFVTFPSM